MPLTRLLTCLCESVEHITKPSVTHLPLSPNSHCSACRLGNLLVVCVTMEMQN